MNIHAETYRMLARNPANREALHELAVASRAKALAMQSMVEGIRTAVETLNIMVGYFESEVPQVEAESLAIEAALREVAQ